jgi:hypothetical protein
MIVAISFLKTIIYQGQTPLPAAPTAKSFLLLKFTIESFYFVFKKFFTP